MKNNKSTSKYNPKKNKYPLVGGARVLPSEYFGNSSGRYTVGNGDPVSVTDATYGKMQAVSQGTENDLGSLGPNLAPYLQKGSGIFENVKNRVTELFNNEPVDDAAQRDDAAQGDDAELEKLRNELLNLENKIKEINEIQKENKNKEMNEIQKANKIKEMNEIQKANETDKEQSNQNNVQQFGGRRKRSRRKRSRRNVRINKKNRRKHKKRSLRVKHRRKTRRNRQI